MVDRQGVVHRNMYLINVGSAAKDATVGCASEPPQPPVSPFVGFAKVYGLIEKWALEKRDIKVYSPFIDVENLVELQNRSKNARSFHICTRRNQRPQVPWDRITHPNFHFHSLDESIVCIVRYVQFVQYVQYVQIVRYVYSMYCTYCMYSMCRMYVCMHVCMHVSAYYQIIFVNIPSILVTPTHMSKIIVWMKKRFVRKAFIWYLEVNIE